jgi:hypothetical protein
MSTSEFDSAAAPISFLQGPLPAPATRDRRDEQPRWQPGVRRRAQCARRFGDPEWSGRSRPRRPQVHTHLPDSLQAHGRVDAQSQLIELFLQVASTDAADLSPVAQSEAAAALSSARVVEAAYSANESLTASMPIFSETQLKMQPGYWSKPVLVLVNENSALAAETFALLIQANHIGVVLASGQPGSEPMSRSWTSCPIPVSHSTCRAASTRCLTLPARIRRGASSRIAGAARHRVLTHCRRCARPLCRRCEGIRHCMGLRDRQSGSQSAKAATTRRGPYRGDRVALSPANQFPHSACLSACQ